jgi:protein-S-isoprenylcysteine O-methyltransferase Ste14
MTVRRWLASTPRRTFILYPVCVVLLELLLRRGTLAFEPAGLLLLVWGYAQYRWSGSYRTQHGGGGPGVDVPPTRIVDTGIYAYMRNPMYLGHLIFMLGLAVTFHSAPALALLIFHMWWFHQRVLEDETHMTALFGDGFADYAHRVRRWGVV